ncbi:MAG: four helix bundle protein [Bacteroidota bacterium]
MHDFKQLRLWHWAMDLTEEVYKLTQKFPKYELYGLTQQLRRSMVSIPSNIAEGAYRNSNKEFNHFLGISNGSTGEVYTQLDLARRLGYLTSEEVDPILEKVDSTRRMIVKLQSTL